MIRLFRSLKITLTIAATGAFLLGSLARTSAQAPAPAAAAAPEVKKNPWEASAAAGLTVTSGNSDTLLFTANLLGTRKWDQNELRLGADGTYGENDSVTSTASAHGFGQYNRLFTEKFFGYLRLDALHDGIADVEYRITLSPGAGYYFVKNARTTLSGEVGPGVVFEKQGDDESTYMTLRIAQRFEHKLNERVRIWESIEFLPQIDDWNNFLINAEIGIETGLTEKLALQVFAQDNYDHEPAPGRKDNDFKLVTAIKYKF